MMLLHTSINKCKPLLHAAENRLIFHQVFLSSVKEKDNPAHHCLELVKRTDHEHYLTNLLLPENIITDSFAIRALNAEISGVRDNVTDKTLGLVRLQFWQDSIDKLYNDQVPRHPVAIQLYRLIKNHRPSQELFRRMIKSREQFLSDKPFSNLEEVEAYSDHAFSSVYLLLLELLGGCSGHAKHAVTQLGKCEGLVTLLRATPFNASKRRCYLPTDLLLEQGVSAERVIRGGEEEESINRVVEIIASRAQQHLESCRFRMKYLDTEHKLLLLPAVVMDSYLERLSKAKCNVWAKELHARNSQLPMTLYWHKIKKSY